MYSTQNWFPKPKNLAMGTNTNVKAHLDEAVFRAAKAGFSVMELQLEHLCRYDHEDPSILVNLVEMQKQYDLRFSGHAPYKKVDLASSDELTRYRSIQAVLKPFPFFEVLGVETVTVHTGRSNSLALANLANSLSILVKEAAKYNLRICLETAGRQGFFATFSTDEYKWLSQTTGCCLTLDLPHLLHIYEDGFLKETAELLPYAKNLHIADCSGTNHQHFPLGHGNFPFSQVWEVLQSSNYQGQITVDAMNSKFSPSKYLQQAVNFREFYSDYLA